MQQIVAQMECRNLVNLRVVHFVLLMYTTLPACSHRSGAYRWRRQHTMQMSSPSPQPSIDLNSGDDRTSFAGHELQYPVPAALDGQACYM